MSTIQSRTDMGQVASVEDLKKFLSPLLSEMADIVNGRLEFGKNIAGEVQTVIFPSTPGTSLLIATKLGRVSQGYVVLGQNGNGNVYYAASNGAGVSTSGTDLVLQCGVASMQVKLFIF